MTFFSIFQKKIVADCGHETLKKKIVADCGHETLKKDIVTAFGEHCITTLPANNGKTEYCHRCLEKMAIRCAWCGGTIFIGDPITLYSPRDKDQKMPDYAVLCSEKHNSYVGCTRGECAEAILDRVGFWCPPGKVYHVLSPIEMALASAQDGKGAFCISDLTDPKETIKR